MPKDGGEPSETDALIFEEKGPSGHKEPWLLLGAMCFSAGIGGGFQYGFNVAVISAPTGFIQRFVNVTHARLWASPLSGHELTLLWSIIVSIFTLGCFLGALLAGSLSRRMGRRGTLLFNNVFALLGAALMWGSHPAASYEILIVGRLLAGVNAGMGLNLQPMYLGESAPQRLRGALSLSCIVFLTLGIVVAQVASLREVLGSEKEWPLLLGLTALPALVQLATLPAFPESPRFLLIDRGDRHGALAALRRLRGPGTDLRSELQDMEAERQAVAGRPVSLLKLLQDRSVRWQITSIVVLSAGQQLSGLTALYSYAEYVFVAAGIAAESVPYVNLGTGLCELFTATCCGMLVERTGRRKLLVAGYLAMAVCCCINTLSLALLERVSWMPYLSVASIFAYILSFGIGPGGVTAILAAELFTQEARPAAFMLSGSVISLSLLAVSLVYPFLMMILGPFTFLAFAAACMLCALYTGLVLPETRDRSFLEISRDFQSLNADKRAARSRTP
uniref:Solute carrier family 2, facilitated glucose transporter member 5 n=1 Tax=Petromyzon marinus TaxID=7757 RepID=A0AAJ7SPT6_PETMA|nr:solute carrier family 2, facilitated glucose transporter member 11-like isoform X1 [Petromyzon marinus]